MSGLLSHRFAFFKTIMILAILLGTGSFGNKVAAQEPPYLFTIVAKQPDAGKWLVNYNSGYGERVFSAAGSNGFDQRVGVNVGLSKRLSLYAAGGVLMNGASEYKGRAVSAELLSNIVRAGASPVDVSIGGGVNNDYNGITSAVARVVLGRKFDKWDVSSNAYFEKAFDSARDGVDMVTMIGVSRQMHKWFRGGVELIAEDMEGFWDKEEAEGGAKMLIGPSLHFNGIHKNIFLTLGAGRVFYLSESIASSRAIRLLPTIPGRDGYVVRAMLTYAM